MIFNTIVIIADYGKSVKRKDEKFALKVEILSLFTINRLHFKHYVQKYRAIFYSFFFFF